MTRNKPGNTVSNHRIIKNAAGFKTPGKNTSVKVDDTIVKRLKLDKHKRKSKGTKEPDIKKIIHQFIKATNAFKVEEALGLFASNAMIDDISVGEKFKNNMGVRTYLERFFVDYHTVTKLESLEVHNFREANAHVDLTGDFGHETGGLNFTLNLDGRIIGIDAYLD